MTTPDQKRSKVEVIKEDSNYLRGTIAQALQDGTSHFSEENIQVLKFHGTYQQDDRDLRKQLRQDGKERHYMMMIRARMPGGVMSADQYLVFDNISEEYGNQTMRITTRQTFQLHGVLKSNLKASIRSINKALMTTLGGCGDQVRNTIGCAAPHRGPYYEAVREDMLKLVDALSAKTKAYHEIWLDGEKLHLDEDGDWTHGQAESQPGQLDEGAKPNPTSVRSNQSPSENQPAHQSQEPLYGKTYLPRKFKLAFAYEGDNCADIYSNDIGIVAHREGDKVSGYTLVIGGGMGRTATDKSTHPAVALPFAFVTREELLETCRAVVEVQRDHGNRVDRKFARMKYLVQDKGIQWFQEQVSQRLNRPLLPPRELVWENGRDHLGWHAQNDGDDDAQALTDIQTPSDAHGHAHADSHAHPHSHGRGYLGIYVENGRIQDTDTVQLKTVLREIMQEFQPEVHLSTQQNILLANLAEVDRERIEAKLRDAGVQIAEELSKVKLNAMACPAMPTCGLAIAESERVLPFVLPQFEALMRELGLEDQDISIRMTGCPNGCARPYVAEIGFVGRVIGKYDVFLGASPVGTRTNVLYKEMVPLANLVETVRPVMEAYQRDREDGEAFGDYVHRVGLEHFQPVAAGETSA